MTVLDNESTSEGYYDYGKERSSSAVHAPSDAEEVEKLVSQVYQHASARKKFPTEKKQYILSGPTSSTSGEGNWLQVS
uniref:EHD_N domain-containing protein n=1 Tax=Ascaris lumbricoides TaxID=6252 RepID=A0A0M3HNT7_ASCLU